MAPHLILSSMKTVSSSFLLLRRLPSIPSPTSRSITTALVISLSRNTPKRAIVSTSLSFVRFSNILDLYRLLAV
ncbi:hypothetical protein Sjap_005758 [Stephania japonica]|uniref:Uncharacterized protein n=1 Tax=Stephania japonica TaxID=461633 RepID=A0AAP0PLF3_9MAGN